MGTGMKVFLGVAALAGIAALIAKGREYANQFAFEITGFGTPSIKNWILTIPLEITFDNPVPTPIPLSRFELDIFMNQGNVWQHVARIDQPLTIPSGVSKSTLMPSVDLTSFFKNDFFQNLVTAVTENTVKFKIDVNTVLPGGLSLPTQTEIMDVKLLNK